MSAKKSPFWWVVVSDAGLAREYLAKPLRHGAQTSWSTPFQREAWVFVRRKTAKGQADMWRIGAKVVRVVSKP